MIFKRGYAWDGPSGPTLDTHTFMRPSLVHDGGYAFMREGKIAQDTRDFWDRLLREMCLEDGMSSIRAWWVYKGVKYGARHSSLPTSKKPVLEAPNV